MPFVGQLGAEPVDVRLADTVTRLPAVSFVPLPISDLMCDIPNAPPERTRVGSGGLSVQT